MTAIFATLLLSGATSAYAQEVGIQCFSLWEINDATVFEDTDIISVLIHMVNCNNLLQFDDYGGAVLTDGTHIATTSHGGPQGFWDSELQSGADDATPHNHYVTLADPEDDVDNLNDCFSQGATAVVETASWESPGIAMFGGTINTGIQDDEYKIWEVPRELDGHFTVLNQGTPGADTTWILGNLDANSLAVTFHLTLGGPSEVCVFVKDSVVPTFSALIKVGGMFLGVDTAALLIAGFQASAIWMIPTIAGIAATGIYLTKFRANKED